uniref:Uncharacterized protein n=1 Tax=Romanomermis culicivorax TaxID=13658 RepID=A0A915K712_ROMCU
MLGNENQCESSEAEQKNDPSAFNSKKNRIPVNDQNTPGFSISSSNSSLLSNSVSNTVLSTSARIEYPVPIFGEIPKNSQTQLSEKSTPILEINPIGSNRILQQPEDAISVQTDFSEDEILNSGGASYADLTDEPDSIFVDIFASLVLEKNIAMKKRLAADVAEEAIEVSYENDVNYSNNNNNSINASVEEQELQGYVLTCTLTQTQVLLACYDCESYLTFRSPNLRLLEQHNSLRNLHQFYAEINTKIKRAKTDDIDSLLQYKLVARGAIYYIIIILYFVVSTPNYNILIRTFIFDHAAEGMQGLAEESTTYREAPDKILNYCAPDSNLDMLKRDLLDIKQEPDEAATKFLKR